MAGRERCPAVRGDGAGRAAIRGRGDEAALMRAWRACYGQRGRRPAAAGGVRARPAADRRRPAAAVRCSAARAAAAVAAAPGNRAADNWRSPVSAPTARNIQDSRASTSSMMPAGGVAQQPCAGGGGQQERVQRVRQPAQFGLAQAVRLVAGCGGVFSQGPFQLVRFRAPGQGLPASPRRRAMAVSWRRQARRCGPGWAAARAIALRRHPAQARAGHRPGRASCSRPALRPGGILALQQRRQFAQRGHVAGMIP